IKTLVGHQAFSFCEMADPRLAGNARSSRSVEQKLANIAYEYDCDNHEQRTGEEGAKIIRRLIRLDHCNCERTTAKAPATGAVTDQRGHRKDREAHPTDGFSRTPGHCRLAAILSCVIAIKRKSAHARVAEWQTRQT